MSTRKDETDASFWRPSGHALEMSMLYISKYESRQFMSYPYSNQ